MGNIDLSPLLKRHKSQMQLIYWKLNPTLASFATLDRISLSSNDISSSYQNGVEGEVVGLRPAGCVNPYFMDAKVVSNSIIIHNLSLSLSLETIT